MLRCVVLCLGLALLGFACSGGGGDPSVTPIPSASPTGTGTATTGLPPGSVTFYGAGAGDQAAAAVAGDFNGDSATDVAIGASLADGPDDGRSDSGEVYLFLGPFPVDGALDAAGGEYDAVFFGAAAGDNLGRTLTAGDYNGDGVDDLAMASPSADGQRGAVYIMFGADWPEQTDLAETEADLVLRGAAASDFAGHALASADLDADGDDDLMVGALLADGPGGSRTDAGAVYVLHGQELAAGDDVDLGSVPGVVHGAQAGDHLGESLTTGDVNGDGKPELVLVATFSAGPDGSRPGAGATYVLDAGAALPIDLATAAPILQVVGTDAGDQLGHSIAAGDANGDGSADLWLGAVSADGPGNAADLAGEGALVLGGPGRSGLIDTAAGGTEAIVYGPEVEARLGRSAAMGDVNGDGLADMVISAPNVDLRAGRVFVFFGGRELPQDAAGADAALRGLDAGDILGHEAFGTPSLSVVSIAGTDSVALLVSAPSGDGPENNRTDCGEVYLIPGVSLRS